MRAFNSSDARIRRLALRGLFEIQADYSIAKPLLELAARDRAAQVRDYAENLSRREWPQPGSE